MLDYMHYDSFYQGGMQYEITGNYPAPDFFGIEKSSGMITLLKDLRDDSLQLNSYEV